MQSRLLDKLLAEARLASDRVAWARAVCRAASHYARHGEHQHAAKSIGMVRAEFELDHNPEVAVWLMLAEGIAHFFAVKTTEAYDRTQRAYAIAKTFSLLSALPTCAAWMAHLQFNAGNYDSMAKSLSEVFLHLRQKDHQAGSRACLVLADAYHFAGSFEKAKPWYEKCRLHATAEEDDATLGALFHNVAAFRAANIRLASAFGETNEPESRRAWTEAESARTFDTLLQGHGLPLLFPLLQGQLLSADGQFDKALGLLQTVDTEDLHQRLRPLVLAEKAWCQTNLGNRSEAWSNILLALNLTGEDIDLDDRAFIYARASQVANLHAKSHEAEQWRNRASELINAHRTLQTSLISKLDNLVKDSCQ